MQQARLVEADQKLASLGEQRRQIDAEFHRKTLSDLTDAETKAASLHDELIKAQQHRDLDTLTAPVDGTIQQLAVHTVGGVVTPAQQLLVLVPADSRLEVEAMVPNKDIGFVHVGEKAEVKVDTFNFTKYGLLHGTVESISRDAIARNIPTDDKGGNAKGSGSTDETSEPSGQELVYAARIALDRTQMDIDGKMVNLGPGMAVTAEIKTGKRRVIQYVLSPLLRYKQDSLRER